MAAKGLASKQPAALGQLRRPVEDTSLLADTAGMAEKPEPPKPTSWNIYKIAKKGVWLGTVEAPDKQSAIKKAAAEFKVDV